MTTDPERAATPTAQLPARPPSESSAEDARWTKRAKYAVVFGLLGTAALATVVATLVTGSTTAPGLPEPGPGVRFGLPLVQALQDLSALATVGLSLLPKLLSSDRPAHSRSILPVARQASVMTALLWTLCAFLSLVFQTAELDPGQPLTTGLLVSYIAEVPAGPGLLLTAAGAFLCAILGLLAVRFGESVPAELRVVAALLSLLPLPVTGHATDWPFHDFSMLSMELHVLAAALWSGGLGAIVLFVAPRRGLLATVLPRFSRMASLCLVTVGVTGVFNAAMQLISTPGVGIPGLVTTSYGHIVIVKMLCVVLLAALGGRIRFRLLPRIARHERTALIGWAAAEISVMGMAYGLGVVLSRAPVV